MLERVELVGSHEPALLRVVNEGGKRHVRIWGIAA